MTSTASEAYLLHLLRRAEEDRAHRDLQAARARRRPGSMASELRSLEFWRAIIGECLASFVYVFLVCGAHVAWPLHSVNTLTKSFCSGSAMAAVAHAFGHLSGAHANPALTLSMLVVRRITPLRAVMYAAAQCGGAIAGAALLYGVTSSPVGLGCTLVADSLSPWQALGLEGVTTFVVGLILFASADPERKSTGNDAVALGLAYLACSLVALPATGASMNPARSLGPAFVTNTWTLHWVYWLGPSIGGVLAGLIYEYIFESPRKVVVKDETEKDASAEARDDTDSKSSSAISVKPAQVHQAPPSCFRAPAPEGPRPHSRSLQAKYGAGQPASYYSTVPRGGGTYHRTWSNSEYGSSQQFKF